MSHSKRHKNKNRNKPVLTLPVSGKTVRPGRPTGFKRTPLWTGIVAIHAIRTKWRWSVTLVLVVSAAGWMLGAEFMAHITMWLTIEHLVHQVGTKVAAAAAEEAQ